MKAEIDQSGRIEYTSKPTVVAVSNGCSFSIIISSSEKQYLQRVYRKAGKSKILMIKTFSILIYLLIKDKFKLSDSIYIDREYVGYDKIIRQFITDLYTRSDSASDMPSIHFTNIGKKSRTHEVAINNYRKKRADKRVTAGDILKLVL